MSSSDLSSEGDMLDDPSPMKDDIVSSEVKPTQMTSSTQVVKRVSSTEEMPPPASRPQKRSHEQLEDTTHTSVQSSDTAIADFAERKQSDTAADSSTTAVPESAGESQPQTPNSPPATPMSSTTIPRSGQGTPVPPKSHSKSQSKSVKPENAPNATSSKKTKQPKHKSSGIESQTEIEHVDPTSLGDPQDMVEDFEWDVLEQRYHDELRKADEREAQIFEDFHHLVNVGRPTIE